MKTDHILTKEYLNELFEYKDGNLFWKKAKVGTAKGTLAGTKSHHYYQICINYKIYRTHRLIWIFHNGNTEDCIDHINGNTFDNCIENLRNCNIAENLWNSKKPKNNNLLQNPVKKKKPQRRLSRPSPQFKRLLFQRRKSNNPVRKAPNNKSQSRLQRKSLLQSRLPKRSSSHHLKKKARRK